MNLSPILKTNLTNTNLGMLFSAANNQKPDTRTGNRYSNEYNGLTILFDEVADDLSCAFVRTPNKTSTHSYQFSLEGGYQLTAIPAGGWLIQNNTQQQAPTYWIPVLPKNRQCDNDQHITSETSVEISGLDISTDALSITVDCKEGFHLDLVIVCFMPSANIIVQQLSTPDTHELKPVFLWGSHTTYSKPADLFLHLIHGLVYENRTAWPYYRKICSENDAHALYVTLSGLEQTSGKEIYALLKRLLVSASISRLGKDGAWRHGEWSNDMEAHFRLHCSGMHLLMDVLSEHHDQDAEDSLKSAAAYIAKQHDSTRIGTWFLHDELELSEESMSKSPFKWVKSKAFGKRLSNMLVLNTHLDSSIALDRYASLTGDRQYAPLVTSARNSTRLLLAAKPAERLYRAVFYIIGLTLLPTDEARHLPTHVRILKRLGWKYLIPNLQHIKKRFPRVVMPTGYIDRALSLRGISPAYQAINTMDLMRYIRRFPNDLAFSDIAPALEFSQQQSFQSYLAESDKTCYALGFWAETLYHLCTINNAPKYRQWLAQALLNLDKRGLGIPPSILGGNYEAISSPLSSLTPSVNCDFVVVANISHALKTEFLLVNQGDTPATMALEGFSMIITNATTFEQGQNITLNPGNWITIEPVNPEA